MALLERVATLVRANLNDLLDRAEDPEKLVKQVILDMENQLLQVKTQVAIGIADQHVLQKRRVEHEEQAAEWMRRAELAVDKHEDDLARAALARARNCRRLADNYEQQAANHTAEVEHLKVALRQLDQKLEEARARSDLLIAQHRRARALRKANAARSPAGSRSHAATFRHLQDKVSHADAVGRAEVELAAGDIEHRLAALAEQEEIEKLLADLKAARKTG
jgi:phage shock protein A